MLCPRYLEWWLDSTLHLVLFIQYTLNTVSAAYICIIWEVVTSSEWWLIHAEWWLFLTSADQCGQNNVYIIYIHIYMFCLNTNATQMCWVGGWSLGIRVYSSGLGLRISVEVGFIFDQGDFKKQSCYKLGHLIIYM